MVVCWQTVAYFNQNKIPIICFIFQANPGVVTTLDNRMHGLQTGNIVTFKEIVGMTALNGSGQIVKG